ncbi:MAG: tRNA lysidine(34) synthetase TilS [Chlamydiales bacterium]|nr:tRNA lysidine(34) synthetase TilS [Chlamydiales bacterium]
MIDPLVSSVKEFLERNYEGRGPLLLGLSGGPDSLALLYLLLECGVNLHLAHIDHGWRSESGEEAALLGEMARSLKLPFHLHTLDEHGTSNMEAEGRETRLKFFSKIYREIDAEALLLAHQADDQAETILKRIFEGAHLLHLGGMHPVTLLEGMRVWRPLLFSPKKELQAWLDAKGFTAFQDKTNLDPRFLRGRMRSEIFPQLAKTFGKEISNNLIRFGKTLQEVAAELERESVEQLKSIRRGPLGSYLEVDKTLSSIRKEALLKKFLDAEGLLLSHESYDSLLEALNSGAASRCFIAKERQVIVDRGILFVVSRDLSWSNLDWQISYEPAVNTDFKNFSWKDLWTGETRVTLPENSYELQPPQTALPFPGASPIKEWWQEHKVPSFLRQLVPVVIKEGVVVHEFLTGRKKQLTNSGSLLQISLKFKLTNN